MCYFGENMEDVMTIHCPKISQQADQSLKTHSIKVYFIIQIEFKKLRLDWDINRSINDSTISFDELLGMEDNDKSTLI